MIKLIIVILQLMTRFKDKVIKTLTVIFLVLGPSHTKNVQEQSSYTEEEVCSPTDAVDKSCNTCMHKMKINDDSCSNVPTKEQRELLRDEHKETMITSLALVPYNENHILPHEKPSREFNLAGQTFTIRQNWQKLGVAAVVWDSAVVLAEYLVQNSALVEGKNVLELGAGTGLTGMVAASLGAIVTVTERAEAMEHLKSTILDNTLDKPWQISAKVLDWTENLADLSVPQPDVVIGADIIYIEETFQDLLRTLMSLAKTEETRVLLSCKIRYDRDLHFLQLLEEHFYVREVLYDKDRDIKIYSVERLS